MPTADIFNGTVTTTPQNITATPGAILGLIFDNPIVISMTAPDDGGSGPKTIDITGQWWNRGTELRMVGSTLTLHARDGTSARVYVEETTP